MDADPPPTPADLSAIAAAQLPPLTNVRAVTAATARLFVDGAGAASSRLNKRGGKDDCDCAVAGFPSPQKKKPAARRVSSSPADTSAAESSRPTENTAADISPPPDAPDSELSLPDPGVYPGSALVVHHAVSTVTLCPTGHQAPAIAFAMALAAVKRKVKSTKAAKKAKRKARKSKNDDEKRKQELARKRAARAKRVKLNNDFLVYLRPKTFDTDKFARGHATVYTEDEINDYNSAYQRQANQHRTPGTPF